MVLLRLFRPGELHQSTGLTWADRYPAIFSVCRDYFAGRADLRILSYGCATGEEVLSLRRYFPTAFIVGVEINAYSLAVARRRVVDERVLLLDSDPARIGEAGPFDAIFCMAVLQRTPMRVAEQGVQDLSRIYPFEKFDAKISELDAWLKKGGLLVVHHAQYSLADAAAGRKYQPLESAKLIRDTGPKFDRRSLRVGNTKGSSSVFVKTGD